MLTHTTTFHEEKSITLMNEVVGGLRYLFQTKNSVTFPLPGTGSAGMNTVLLNLVEPRDTVVVGVNGYWSHRAAQYAEKIGTLFILHNIRNGII